MKTLITHTLPHLDDICAMWLMKRYFPEAKDAAIDFIPANEKGGDITHNPDYIYIGIGRGKFDEHKGDIGQCATTLVFLFLQEKGCFDARTLSAVQKIVGWVLKEDMGELNTIAYRDFTVPVIVEQGFYLLGGDHSMEATELGFTLLDALLRVQQNVAHIEEDWKKRIEFDSRYGRTVALEATARKVDTYAYAKGFDLVLITNPEHTYNTFRARAESTIDLTDVYEKIKIMEPEARWYFHHAKKLLICGGDHGAKDGYSSLTLQQMIDLVK